MGKWIKWILILLVVFQIFTYFNVKNNIPPMVVALIEKNGCEGYEVPTTETETTVQMVGQKVTIIDTSLPFGHKDCWKGTHQFTQ